MLPTVSATGTTHMRFSLIDAIVKVDPGVSIQAVKKLLPTEEYLQDHFPRFPVMPGVLMLEALYQAGIWLVHRSEDFSHSIVRLKEARNVKYQDFVQPGQVLEVTVDFVKQDDQTTTVKAQGIVGEKSAVNARLILERYNLADKDPEQAVVDQLAQRQLRQLYSKLCQSSLPPDPTE